MTDFLTKTIERLSPGAQWELLDDRILWLSPDINQPTDSEIEAEYALVVLADKAATIRKKRGELLHETDWMAMSDVTMAPEYTVYRQALRDIPAQAGFPNTVIWPASPE